MKSFVGKNIICRVLAVIASMLMTNIVVASSFTPLHNDELRNIHAVEPISYYEYEEKLERGKLTREVEFETTMAGEAYELEEEIETQNNYNGVDASYRTNFFSSDNGTNINVLENSNDFYYRHTLPPTVDPSNPDFDVFDFRTGLFEFELELEGWATDYTADFALEVLIMTGDEFTDNALTGGTDIASLGFLSFDSNGEFKFEFEQYDDFIDGNGIFINDEIYAAIADGVLGIHLARTSGSGNLFLSDSELELEKPSIIPAPPAFILFSSALLFFWGSKRPLRKIS